MHFYLEGVMHFLLRLVFLREITDLQNLPQRAALWYAVKNLNKINGFSKVPDTL